jgi:uncharacterized protein
VGLTGSLLLVVATEMDPPGGAISPAELLQGLAQTIGSPALTLTYVLAIGLALGRPAGRRLLAPLAPVGRMALSNYLFQSLVCTTIFYGYGLGLYGKVSPLAGVGIAVAVFAAQVPLSRAWLARFRFGPMEWLWRSATYGSVQPLRLTSRGRPLLS